MIVPEWHADRAAPYLDVELCWCVAGLLQTPKCGC
jgi:hypothetical protein